MDQHGRQLTAGGHASRIDHHAAENQLAGGSRFSGGQPYISGLQIARKGGRGGGVMALEAAMVSEAATVSEAAMADGGHIMDLARVMVLAMVVTMMILLRPYIFNERIIHKKPQEHRLTIGIIAVIQKAITHISRSARMAGYRSLPCHKLHQLHNEDSSC